MAALELADAKLEPQKIKRNLDDERETRAAYLAAFKDGWRYLADERRWIQVDEHRGTHRHRRLTSRPAAPQRSKGIVAAPNCRW
jgi:hypothetical protein